MGINRLQSVFREKRSNRQWGRPPRPEPVNKGGVPAQLPQAAAAAGSQLQSPAPATAAVHASSSALQEAQARAPVSDTVSDTVSDNVVVSDNVAGAAQDVAKSALPVKDAKAARSSPSTWTPR